MAEDDDPPDGALRAREWAFTPVAADSVADKQVSARDAEADAVPVGDEHVLARAVAAESHSDRRDILIEHAEGAISRV